MSTTPPVAEQPTEQDVQAALEKISEEIFVPTFFEKLAELGIRPNSDAEVQQLLQLSVMLDQAGYQLPAEKTAGENPFLSSIINKVASVVQQRQQPELLKAAAAQVAETQPELRKAAALIGRLRAAASA